MADEIELNEEEEQTIVAVEAKIEAMWTSRDENPGLKDNAEWMKWNKKLVDFAKLENGWDSYDTAPPSPVAIKASEGFLEFLCKNGMSPSRLSPSVVGGVAFTFRNGPHMVYVELRNTGNAHAAFTDDGTDDTVEPEVIEVRQNATGYAELIAKAKSHLHEQTALSHED